jgi:hypothetical protein
MSPHDVFNVLELLSQGQNSGVRVLEFSIGNDFNYDAELENDTASPRDVGVDSATGDLDNGISEPLYLTVQSPSDRTADSELRAASPRDIGIDSATTEPDNLNDMSEPGPSSHLQDSFLPLSSAPATASPVVDPPSKSLPPSSESMIKLAIENVARAGHLTINSEEVGINVAEDLSKPGRKAKISTSKSKKRAREEGSQSEDMPKAQRAKMAVPPREQSSRYATSDILSLLLTFYVQPQRR